MTLKRELVNKVAEEVIIRKDHIGKISEEIDMLQVFLKEQALSDEVRKEAGEASQEHKGNFVSRMQ